jgi:SAM-dependent methyltransferase
MSMFEQNRLSWNQVTRTGHLQKETQEAFFFNGGNTLYPEEQELLGDISGRTVVHLLCNSGQDTLSLARLGAIVSGVDISDVAISFAEKLSQETHIPGTFYCAEVLEWLELAMLEHRRFDIVFCSYGAVRWIAHLDRWAKRIASILESQGRFVVVDFHPIAMMFDQNWHHAFPYCSEGKITTFEKGVGANHSNRPFTYTTVADYSGDYSCHTFDWGLGEIVTALANAGLHILTLKEYPYSRCIHHFAEMRATSDGRVISPAEIPAFPLLYGISATKG